MVSVEDDASFSQIRSLFAGARILLGRDPKADYQDRVANVQVS